MMKMCKECYQGRTLPKCGMSFRIDKTVKDVHATIQPCPIEEPQKLEKQYVTAHRSLCREMQCVVTQYRPYVAYDAHRNGVFQSTLFQLTFQELDF